MVSKIAYWWLGGGVDDLEVAAMKECGRYGESY